MLTPAATRVRDWALFAAAAMTPAVATGVLGLRALANEEAGARREVAVALDAAAERTSADVERDLVRAATSLGRAAVPGDAPEAQRALREIAPAFAQPVVLDAARALLYPRGANARPSTPRACVDAMDALSMSRDQAARDRARTTFLAECEGAQRGGRWIYPVVALDAVRRGSFDAAALAAWFEAHAGALSDVERRASEREIDALAVDAAVKQRAHAALGAKGSRQEELVAALAEPDVAAAIRGKRDASGVVTWSAARSAGALRVFEDGHLAGFVADAATITDAIESGAIAAPPGVVAELVVGAAPPARSRAGSAPLEARATVASELAVRFRPADARALARHAKRSRALLAAIGAATTALAFALAGVLFARMRAARRSSELRTDFVSTVSHELRTPIASVRMLAELLEEERVTPEEHAEIFAALAREARRLGETVDRLLGFSRMEAGRYALDRRAVSVAEAIEPSIRTFEERHPSLPVERALDAGVVASLDADQVRLAVDNLLANAAKYAPEGAPYRVAVTRARGGVDISVSDRGPGVARRDHARIFQPFERVDDKLSRATEGSGIGLSLVRHVARAHGGRARVESAPGRGATFTIHLPGAEA